MKKLGSIVLIATLFCACVILGGCSSDLNGTTWYYAASGEIRSIEFSDDKTAVTSDGLSVTYEIDKDTITLSSGLGSTVLTRTKTDGVDTLVADSGEIMYQDPSIPQKEIGDKKSANIEKANAEKQKYIQELTNELTGSYHYEWVNSYYDYKDTRDVVFNDDGTWTFQSVSHEIDRAGGNVNVAENTAKESGTWEIVYDDEIASTIGTTLTKEEICDAGAFVLKLIKADGSEFSPEEQNALKFEISIGKGDGKPALNIGQYTKVA